jgi:hypothetical protein
MVADELASTVFTEIILLSLVFSVSRYGRAITMEHVRFMVINILAYYLFMPLLSLPIHQLGGSLSLNLFM